MGAEREERQTELEKRRAQRKERAAQRERQKKARRTLLLRLTAALVLIGLAAGVIVWVNRSGQPERRPRHRGDCGRYHRADRCQYHGGCGSG